MRKCNAKNDFNISDKIYSMIKFVEAGLRALICNNYGDVEIKKSSYIFDITKGLNKANFDNKQFNEIKCLLCDTFYDKKLEDECTLYDFINISSLQTIKKVFCTWPNDLLIKNGYSPNDIEGKVDILIDVRNHIVHNNGLVACKDKEKNKSNAYQNTQ